MELSERKLKILAAIVNTYVETGEPVGSKLLALELGVSSATIRNEMANLVEMGYLQQPHTSAGRIPSQKGYRIYIDKSDAGSRNYGRRTKISGWHVNGQCL
ncbi:MAG: hypothetical protein ACLTE2_07400 [Eubacteriales bacterium]